MLHDYPKVNEMFSDQIIRRAPDKMIDFLQGNILLAYRDLMVYVRVSEYGVDDPSKIPSNVEDRESNFVHINVPDDKVSFLDLHRNYKIISIQEIGNEMSAIVLEDLVTRQLRFLRAYYDEKVEGERRLKLVQLGVLVNNSKMTESPLLKFRSVAKIDPSTQKRY